MNAFSGTSGEKGFFIDADGQQWIVKDNPTDLIVNEYVASKVYAHISNDTTSDIRLLACSTPALAIKVTPNFFPYSTERLQIDGFSIADAANMAKLFHGKPVLGLNEAIYATLITFDDDVYKGINFALVESKNSVHLHRFDFDDSFKFYSSFYITQNNLDTETLKKARQLGYSKADLQAELYVRYQRADIAWLEFKFPTLKRSGLRNRIESVHSKIYADREKIFDLVAKAYEEVSEVFTNAQLVSAFDLSALQRQASKMNINIAQDTSTWADWLKGGSPKMTTRQLADFTNGMLLKRMQEVQTLVGKKVEL